MCWLKAKQILVGIGIALAILMFFEITLFVPLVGGTGTIKVGNAPTRAASEMESTLVLLFFALMAIIGGEVARVFIRKSFALDASKIKVSTNSAASTLGTMALVRDVIFAPLFSLVMLLADGLLLLLLANQIFSRPLSALPMRFWLVLGLFALYLLIRPVLALVLRPVGRSVTSLMPTFAHDGNAITLDLKRKRGLPPSQRKFISVGTEPCIVKIGFDELDEVRAFSYVEAQSFVQYELGPDLQLALKQGKDLYRYLNGELDRPSVYGHWGALGTTLLLRGPNLCYLISVSNDNVNELVAVFNIFKQRAPVGQPG